MYRQHFCYGDVREGGDDIGGENARKEEILAYKNEMDGYEGGRVISWEILTIRVRHDFVEKGEKLHVANVTDSYGC